MEYVTPEMEIVTFKANVYMTLSLENGSNNQGSDDEDDMNIDF